MASTARTREGSDGGGKIMLAGIIIQLISIILYTILGLEFAIRYNPDRPARSTADEEQCKRTGWDTVSPGVVWMLAGLANATLFVTIRSIYRTIELTDAWNGETITTEKWFNWLDGMPIAVAMFTYNIFSPGYLLRDLQSALPLSAMSSKVNVELRQV